MMQTGLFKNVTSLRNAVVSYVILNETQDGYEVRTESPITDRAILIERMCVLAGLATILGALTGILAAKAHSLPGFAESQMASGGIILTGGVAFLWIAIRGMRHQVNFDLVQRVVRLVSRNHTGAGRTLRTIGFDQITSAFITRPSGPGRPARLFIRVGNGDDLIEVARGNEAELRTLHDRIRRDLAPQADLAPSISQRPDLSVPKRFASAA